MEEQRRPETTLLTVEEVARRLDVSKSLVYRLFADRDMEQIRVGTGRGRILVSEEELERYLSDRRA